MLPKEWETQIILYHGDILFIKETLRLIATEGVMLSVSETSHESNTALLVDPPDKSG